MPHYTIHLAWSDEDGCWIAAIPALPGCASHGDTPARALANVQDAMRGWLEVASAKGIPIPPA